MGPESIQKLTPDALAALHELDAPTATEVVKKLLAHVHEHPDALANLYASGLLGAPDKPWSKEHCDRVAYFIEFACGSDGFERGGRSEMLIRSWLDAVQPVPVDMSRLLFMSDKDGTDLRDYFIEAGANAHLPIDGVQVKSKTGRYSYSAQAIVFAGVVPVLPSVAKLLVTPTDDLPIVTIGEVDSADPSAQNLLDVALNHKGSDAVEIILAARKGLHPRVAKAMTDSLSRAIDEDKPRWLLRLLAVGAEPGNGDWQPIVEFLQNSSGNDSAPRLITRFREEAAETDSLRWLGRPALATTIERLVEHGLDINLVDDEGHGMVFLASHYGYFTVLDTLLALGANYKDVLERYEDDRPDFAPFAAGEHAKHMLLAHVARDVMSGFVKKTRANAGEQP